MYKADIYEEKTGYPEQQHPQNPCQIQLLHLISKKAFHDAGNKTNLYFQHIRV